ncbi:recombination directionality factor [Kitasatospora indigofera]|uniref:recombination directionality factor n=1 Tax=Kitasatospora indigofera TaxID=67307 RepID=UPI0033A470CE
MAIRIFETDPDALPKGSLYADDSVGRFHSGRQVDGVPEALSEWRITTGDPEVASAVAQLFKGSVVDTESPNENHLEVQTDRAKVLVILDGPDAIASDMKLWNTGMLVHHCDGVEHLSPDDVAGRPCGCPPLMEDRKAAAKRRMGPGPSISVSFALADDPDLGKFRFQSGSWKLAEVLHEYENALTRVGAPALAELSLELVEYTTKKGRDVSYVKPVIKVLKAWNDAIAEPKY